MRKQVEFSDSTYLDLIGRFEISRYVRLAIDERLERVRGALSVIRYGDGRTDEEICQLISAADMPARIAETESDLPTLRAEVRAALYLLAAEGESTGLDPAALIAALDSGRGA